MGFPLSGIQSLIGVLYNDKLTAYRYMNVENPDGTTDKVRGPVPELTNIPCRLSFTRVSERLFDTEEARTPVLYEPTVFCPPGAKVKAGDYLEISRMKDDGTVERIYEGNAEDPRWYPSHSEIRFRVDGTT